MLVNSSFTITLLTKMHEIACLAKCKFKIFRERMRPDDFCLPCLFWANRISLLIMPPVMLYLTHMKTFALNPDQLSRRHWANPQIKWLQNSTPLLVLWSFKNSTVYLCTFGLVPILNFYFTYFLKLRAAGHQLTWSIEPWFVLWRDVVEPKCPWRD